MRIAVLLAAVAVVLSLIASPAQATSGEDPGFGWEAPPPGGGIEP